MCLGVRVALTPPYAQVVKWEDTPVLSTGPEKGASSNLALCTNYICTSGGTGRRVRLRT